jgi:pimeloyl-ACP methyl ester carboxylesterase
VNPSCTDVPPIVLTHGAGSGMAFFYKNIEALANLNGVRRRLLVFDWLGQAGSSRPSFPYGAFADKPSWMLSEDAKIDAAIRFATEALEAWCRAMGLTQFELLAHSMGGSSPAIKRATFACCAHASISKAARSIHALQAIWPRSTRWPTRSVCAASCSSRPSAGPRARPVNSPAHGYAPMPPAHPNRRSHSSHAPPSLGCMPS